MKISPMGASPSAIPAHTTGTISPERIARATAAFAGQDPNSVQSETTNELPSLQSAMNKIKLNTQRTILRDLPEHLESSPEVSGEVSESPSATARPASDDSEPLSPQFAALAKAKRAAQLREAAILQKERELESKLAGFKSTEDLVSTLKSDPLRVLREQGVTYDQLTEAVLKADTGDNPQVYELKNQLKALEQKLDNSWNERDQQAREQAKRQIDMDVRSLVSTENSFPHIKAYGLESEVTRLIESVFDNTGELWGVEQAAREIEQAQKARHERVQSQLNPNSAAKLQDPVLNNGQPRAPSKTLISRDSSQRPLTPKERALLAFQGRLK